VVPISELSNIKCAFKKRLLTCLVKFVLSGRIKKTSDLKAAACVHHFSISVEVLLFILWVCVCVRADYVRKVFFCEDRKFIRIQPNC
jgi:hypothetical protein